VLPLAITIGLLLATVVNNASTDRQDTGSCRIPIAVQFAWAIVLVFGMLILPETSRHLIKRGRLEQAAKSLSCVRHLDIDHSVLVDELAEIQANGKQLLCACFPKAAGLLMPISHARPSGLQTLGISGSCGGFHSPAGYACHV
jgi:hypothetical protein